jgi:hypothetical protein
MSYQTFIANSTLTSSQMNNLQSSVYTWPKSTVSATAYTLTQTDRGKLIEFTASNPVTVTIPNESSVVFTEGTEILFFNAGTSTVTFVGSAGVSVNAEGGLLTLPTQWSTATLIKRGSNAWLLAAKSAQVTESEIVNLAVSTAKLADSAVTTQKLGDLSVTTLKLADNAVTPQKLADVAIDNKTANYSLVLTDKNKIIEMDLSSANTVTIPPYTGAGSVAFPVGTQITVVQMGTGKTQVVAAVPATTNIRATPGVYLRAQNSSATLVKRADEEWYLFGDLSAT